jgi:hypothetical protein
MADPAAYALSQIDEWHGRLKVGGSARPSPTIAVAQSAGYERLASSARGAANRNDSVGTDQTPA